MTNEEMDQLEIDLTLERRKLHKKQRFLKEEAAQMIRSFESAIGALKGQPSSMWAGGEKDNFEIPTPEKLSGHLREAGDIRRRLSEIHDTLGED